MPKVTAFKMTYQSEAFNLNQQVWVQFVSGDLSAMVTGPWRGKGRWVSAWVSWRTPTHPVPRFVDIDVPEGFATRHRLAQDLTARLEESRAAVERFMKGE